MTTPATDHPDQIRVTDAPKDDLPADAPSYETARDELLDIVRRLESGSANLEDSLTLWERGEYLAEVCERHLSGAMTRIQAVTGEGESEAEKSSEER